MEKIDYIKCIFTVISIILTSRIIYESFRHKTTRNFKFVINQLIRCLIKNEGPCKLSLSKLCLDKKETSRIAKVGLPAGFQGAIFSISNVLIQSSVNSFGAIAVAGNTATCNLEGFVLINFVLFSQ